MLGLLGKALQKLHSSCVRDTARGRLMLSVMTRWHKRLPDVEAIIAKLGRSRNSSRSHFFADPCSSMKTSALGIDVYILTSTGCACGVDLDIAVVGHVLEISFRYQYLTRKARLKGVKG